MGRRWHTHRPSVQRFTCRIAASRDWPQDALHRDNGAAPKGRQDRRGSWSRRWCHSATAARIDQGRIVQVAEVARPKPRDPGTTSRGRKSVQNVVERGALLDDPSALGGEVRAEDADRLLRVALAERASRLLRLLAIAVEVVVPFGVPELNRVVD